MSFWHIGCVNGSGSDCLSGDEPEAPRIATTLNLRVRDAGLDGTGGAFIPAGLSLLRSARMLLPLFVPPPPTGFLMMHSFRVSSLNCVAAACCAVFALAAPLTYAQQPESSTAPRPVTTTEESRKQPPELSLQASAFIEVPQDLVRITLATEFDADTQSKAMTDLSAILDEAVKRTDGAKGIQVQTSGYNIWPNTDKKGKIQNWRARGEIVLESKDFAAASALASKLSDKIAISQIGFALSRGALDAAESKLLKQAADAFSNRAQAATTAFGYSSYRVLQLDLGGGGPEMSYSPPMRGMAKSSLSSASGYSDAPLEAGLVTVTLSVNGKVALH